MQFTQFTKTISCFSLGCSDKSNEAIDKLNNSNKILLPTSVLSELNNFEVKFPIFFELENEETGNKFSCGVHEFTSAPGTCFLPYRIMQYLWIKEGGNVKLNLIVPEKGTDIKLKIVSKDFLKLTDPKTVLEKILSEYYPIVSVNETLSINYNNQIYYIDITECKPSNTIQITDVDLNVDFEKIDEPEKEKQDDKKEDPSNELLNEKLLDNKDKIVEFKKNKEFVPFSGKGYTLGSK